ncbi:putative sugar ABC transporter periplasmic sugar-binding protein [Myxococcus stipitatus DSM 14675]|uniref:Putative sugar ABC transporter periplasmic sugar-binding protein n=1 Tax=Myxococcus stipitatus (strain DSM 14675 / JCM 12634 / Mx s8) TaxID=1278073 RepID=L7UMI3_MYXSD|nr:ABC transporter substrate-binding protein [Myxococcus stipitatus]AGC49223.1 putative sugar ABC transporter periplasmic sugar-binding protein [Myxococcus stipitatus DSM 14675]
MVRTLVFTVVMGLVVGLAQGCQRSPGGGRGEPGVTRLVLKYQPLWGPPEPFRELLARFERENPGVTLVTEALPNSSDLAHQFFLTALGGGAADFDVLIADVVWVPEFARAGWIADLSEAFPPERVKAEFLPGPVEAAVLEGRTYAVPWYLDVGVLYFRTDLVPRAPRTYAELERFALEARAKVTGMQGFVWQGRQYEGLSCNVYEALWGHGGRALGDGGRVLLDTEAGREALAYLRGLLTRGVSPETVMAFGEEESRRVFQEGRAVFMRNWPYAWGEAQKEDSPIRGRVGMAPLPTVDGAPGFGALGGYQLAVNAHVSPERKKLAAKLIAHLTSHEANLVLAVHYARNPPRKAVYDDPRLKARAPFIASLREMAERARSRPATPYYNLIADVLQSEFSAAVAGLRTPEAALQRAQRQVDHLTGEDR